MKLGFQNDLGKNRFQDSMPFWKVFPNVFWFNRLGMLTLFLIENLFSFQSINIFKTFSVFTQDLLFNLWYGVDRLCVLLGNAFVG